MAVIPPDAWQLARRLPGMGITVAELAGRGSYNGAEFHRTIKDFVIRGGDRTGTGPGGASVYGKQFEEELHPDLKFTGAGVLTVANAGPTVAWPPCSD